MRYAKPILQTLALLVATALLVLLVALLPNWFRHDSTVAEQSRYQIPLDPAVYAGYTGIYRRGDLVMTVTQENGRLFEQLVDRPRREIFPFSRTEFFFKDIRAEITFVVDGQGRATALDLNQFGIKRLERIR